MEIGKPVGLAGPAPNPALKKAAQALEANFLAEMLKAAGVGKTPDSFGGGAGEDQFASFLIQEQARAMAAKGGIGLGDALYNAMKEKFDDRQ